VPSTEPAVVAVDACAQAPAPPVPPATLTVAVTASLDPARLWRAPNAAERFVAAHGYETLVSTDCMGRIASGIAASWRWEASTKQWILVLRDGIRYWSGDPVGAREVVAAWRETVAAQGRDVLSRIVDSTTVLDDRTLVIRLPHDELARLADLAFAVRRPADGSPWPEGTGGFRIRVEPAGVGALRTTLRLESVRGDAAPSLTIHAVPPSVARDLVDAGVDLLLTDAFDLVSYATGRPGLRAIPLPWERIYMLVTAIAPPGADSLSSPDVIASRREALARNVVGGDARAAVDPRWWRGGSDCEAVAPSASPAPAGTRIVYDRSDRVARALAERVVAVTGMSSRRGEAAALVAPALAALGSRLTAFGLGSAELEASLREGREAAWIVTVPRQVATGCLARERLARAIPWLALPAGDSATHVAPLVETRWHVLFRADRVGLTVAGDGAPRLVFSGTKP
jgi:hypothetical protein